MPTLARLTALCLLALAAAALPARADIVFAIDTSSSSPAMHADSGAAFTAAVAPHIANRVAAQPLGARLAAFYVGDHGAIDVPLLDKTIQRIRTADGDTAKAYAQRFPRFLAAELERRRTARMPSPSHLTAGVADARRLVRPGQPCEIVLVSDLAEWDGKGLQYPRDWARPLPKPDGLNLKDCAVTVYGAGQGLQPKPANAILRHWETWLKSAGAEAVSLQRF